MSGIPAVSNASAQITERRALVGSLPIGLGIGAGTAATATALALRSGRGLMGSLGVGAIFGGIAATLLLAPLHPRTVSNPQWSKDTAEASIGQKLLGAGVEIPESYYRRDTSPLDWSEHGGGTDRRGSVSKVVDIVDSELDAERALMDAERQHGVLDGSQPGLHIIDLAEYPEFAGTKGSFAIVEVGDSATYGKDVRAATSAGFVVRDVVSDQREINENGDVYSVRRDKPVVRLWLGDTTTTINRQDGFLPGESDNRTRRDLDTQIVARGDVTETRELVRHALPGS